MVSTGKAASAKRKRAPRAASCDLQALESGQSRISARNKVFAGLSFRVLGTNDLECR